MFIIKCLILDIAVLLMLEVLTFFFSPIIGFAMFGCHLCLLASLLSVLSLGYLTTIILFTLSRRLGFHRLTSVLGFILCNMTSCINRYFNFLSRPVIWFIRKSRCRIMMFSLGNSKRCWFLLWCSRRWWYDGSFL